MNYLFINFLFISIIYSTATRLTDESRMIVYLSNTSFASLDALPHIAQGELNYFVDAIDSATSLKDLQALLLDDIEVMDEHNFNIAIKDNATHIVANISGQLNEKQEVTIQIQCYD